MFERMYHAATTKDEAAKTSLAELFSHDGTAQCDFYLGVSKEGDIEKVFKVIESYPQLPFVFNPA